MSSTYEIRFFNAADRGSLEDLYRAIYGEVWRAKTSLDWTLDHPLAEGGAAVAIQDGVVVSSQPYCDFPLHTPWGAARATLLLDVATHPSHQRRGLFKRVVATASRAAFDRGASIIMTTPNRISFRGFQTLPGWVRLCSLDCMFLPLGAGDCMMDSGLISNVARRALTTASLLYKLPVTRMPLPREINSRVEAPWLPSSDADELWSRAVAHLGISIARDRAFLQWRFGSQYRLFIDRDSQAPTGYVAARIIRRSGLQIGIILDCLTNNDETSALFLLSSVVAWLKEQGASAAMAYFLHKTAPWYYARSAGFLRIPAFCTPRDYPVCVNVRPGDPHYSDFLDASYWHLSLTDSDLV